MTLRERVRAGGLFQGYAYGYPHKTAYRPLDPPAELGEAWAGEEVGALFLYAHLPFCEARCGFCNLFTTTGAEPSLVALYLDALERQADAVRGLMPAPPRASRVALGGGTPTFLSVAELERLFRILEVFPRAESAPVAVEMSPGTIDPAKLAWLREAGVTRASLGAQSFHPDETRALGRPQDPALARRALGWLRAAEFPVLNVDLIYGMAGQTRASWRASLEEATRFDPQELFLYPLYVRPLTGMDRAGRRPIDAREALYREGRDWLLERGWRQVSMRLFRSPNHPAAPTPEYCCQEDGMLGLGAGARSYTRGLHYSTEWAVGRAGVREIIDHYLRLPAGEFTRAAYGCRVSDAEQRRRYVIKGILRANGLDAAAYRAWFGTSAAEDFPALAELVECGAAAWEGEVLRPTTLGLEWSDVIGPWLYSAEVEERMRAYVLA